ncbi:PepSY-like domain-containing protein [Brachyspira pilosicoli]|uniref:PepSY-like domain-containing protein n=1 Tax=Brachyspira pilosicoli TaxID=52584 RepID=UPI003006C7BD
MFKKLISISSLFLIIIFPFELFGYESLDKLPENSKTFIEDNFNNANIKTINKINNCFHVLLEDDCLLIFNDIGNWCEVDGNNKPIPTNFIPENVLYTISKTNPNTNILKIVKKWNTYIITLDNHINIFIDSSGMLVGQKIPD